MIIIKTKNLELTPHLREFIEEKIGSLKKFIDFLEDEAFVEVEKETRHHRKGGVFCAKAEIMVPGKKIMAEAKGEDLLNIVVELKDELQQEIKKYKARDEIKIREQRKSKPDLEM